MKAKKKKSGVAPMEEFSNNLKRVLTRKVLDQTEASRYCFGCDDSTEFPHTCNSTFVEKLETSFNRVWYAYSAINSFQIKERLYRAVLTELFSEHMPRSEAAAKAEQLNRFKWTKDGGGSPNITSTSTDEEDIARN